MTHGGKSREMIKTNPTLAAQTHGNHMALPLAQQPKIQTRATLGNPPHGKTKTMKDLAEKTLAEKTGQINRQTLLPKQIHGPQAEKHKKKEIPIAQEIPLVHPKQTLSPQVAKTKKKEIPIVQEIPLAQPKKNPRHPAKTKLSKFSNLFSLSFGVKHAISSEDADLVVIAPMSYPFLAH